MGIDESRDDEFVELDDGGEEQESRDNEFAELEEKSKREMEMVSL